MSDLRRIEKCRNKEIVEKRLDFSHDLKKKEHIKPKVYSTSELPFNPNVNDVEQPPFNPNVLKSEKKPFNPNSERSNVANNEIDMKLGPDGPEDINSITINIDLSDDKTIDGNKFTSGVDWGRKDIFEDSVEADLMEDGEGTADDKGASED